MSERKYYWLKLRDDFFSSKRIKKLRNMAGGDTYCIIYLKLQLLAMKNDGIIHWTGLEDNIASELALDLDEKEDDVSVTLMYLLQTGLAETSDNIDFFFPYAVENTGSETSAAKRMRDMRERNNVTPLLRDRYVEIDIEKEKDIEIENREKSKKFTPPTLEEVQDYAKERESSTDPVKFWQYYDAGGWKDGQGKPVKNWKQKFLTWERHDEQNHKPITGRNIKASCDPDKYPKVSVNDIWEKVNQI